jgi:hypothetical protein
VTYLKQWGALVIATIALVIAIHGHGRSNVPDAKHADPAACVDQQAREQTEKLAVAVARQNAQRDERIAELAAGDHADRGSDANKAPAPRDSGPVLFEHFDVPNPAVTVTQKPDGVIEAHATDPGLKGTVMTIKAYTKSGDEQTMYVRIL